MPFEVIRFIIYKNTGWAYMYLTDSRITVNIFNTYTYLLLNF